MTVKELMESNIPHQVMFYDGEGMCAGILFQNHIICGCCGGVFLVEDVVETAQENGIEAIRLFKTWVDVSDEIKGDGDGEGYSVTVSTENGGCI